MEFIWAGVMRPTESRNSSSWMEYQCLCLYSGTGLGAYGLDCAERPGAHGKLQVARGRHGEATGLGFCERVCI